MNTKTIIAAIATTLLCVAASHAQNWQSGYSQNGSYTGPNGRTVSYNNNVTYTQGAGGWMGTGCPQGLGWVIFGLNAMRGVAANQPIATPCAAPAYPYGGGYGGGYGYGGAGYPPAPPVYGGGCYGGGYAPSCRPGWR